jgi:hypothetical protein
MSPTSRQAPLIALDEQALHQRLAEAHRRRLAPMLTPPAEEWRRRLEEDLAFRIAEHAWIEGERAAIWHEVARAPRDPAGFLRWFSELETSGPGQGDELFPWLAAEATYREMCWFLQQEMAGEAGFDDLVALSQLKLPMRAKLEMARNYWDEMGQGTEGGMHGPMLARLGRSLPEPPPPSVWETLALGNLMVALATQRAYAYQSIGALGVIELTAPGRAQLVNAGLKRLGFEGPVRRYYALHATLDQRHSQTWNREVLGPLVAEYPDVAPLLAEGALLRLRAGERCFERYRAELMPQRLRIVS